MTSIDERKQRGNEAGHADRSLDHCLDHYDVAVFTPSIDLTVHIEPIAGAEDRIDLHAGGHGFWTSRTTQALDCRTCLCAPLGGESGSVLRTLVAHTGVEFVGTAVSVPNACRIRDGRDVDRSSLARMSSGVLARHDLDDLYGAMLAAAVQSRVAVITSPGVHREISPSVYRRLVTDLEALDATVVASVSGAYLRACAEAGGMAVLQTSDEELVGLGLAHSETEADLAAGLRKLGDAASCVVMTRRTGTLLALAEDTMYSVTSGALEEVDRRGASDALTGGIACGLAEGLPLLEAVGLGAAAAMVSVTRHSRSPSNRAAVAACQPLVRIDEREV